MNGLPYYKAYPRDFIEGTIGMAFELKAAYRLVIDLIYMQGGKLPDDPRYISGLIGCSVRAWKKYRDELISLGKIQAQNGIISNFRADKELETLAKLQDKQRENASGPRKNKDLEKPRQNHTEPEPNIKEEEPDGFLSVSFSQFWEVWPNRNAKAAAEKAWKKLTDAERAEARDSAAAWFSAWRASNKDASPIHPASYINQKRWEDEGWRKAPAKAVDRMAVAADAIRSGKRFLCANITPSLARELVAANAVTSEQCKQVGVSL